jgi:hypothetical protein
MSDSGVADARIIDALADAIAGMAVIALLTCFLFWSVCMTSASLITTFPRTVLNMISFSEPGLNPYENTAQGIMGGLSGMVKAPMSIATNSVIRRFTTPRNPTSPNNGAGGS